MIVDWVQMIVYSKVHLNKITDSRTYWAQTATCFPNMSMIGSGAGMIVSYIYALPHALLSAWKPALLDMELYMAACLLT